MYDYDDQVTWLDSEAFAAYCVRLAKAIKRVGRASIRDQREQMGDEFVRKYHFDAIERLVAAGEIRQVCFISPLRWETDDTPARQVETKWNRSQPTIPRAVQPDNDQQYRAARA